MAFFVRHVILLYYWGNTLQSNCKTLLLTEIIEWYSAVILWVIIIDWDYWVIFCSDIDRHHYWLTLLSDMLQRYWQTLLLNDIIEWLLWLTCKMMSDYHVSRMGGGMANEWRMSDYGGGSSQISWVTSFFYDPVSPPPQVWEWWGNQKFGNGAPS